MNMTDIGEEDDRQSSQNLGTCCACGASGRRVRNLLMMDFKGQSPGDGWGCLVCGLPNDGAMAVLCDECVEADAAPHEICAGKAEVAPYLRIPLEGFERVPFEHDQAKHQAYEAGHRRAIVEASADRLIAARLDDDELNAIVTLLPKEKAKSALAENSLAGLAPLERLALKIVAAAVTEPGNCMICGCTYEQPCPEGCAWVNSVATLCSACLERA